MNKTLENSCFKGCLVYFFVLGLLVALGAIGLGSLSATFGLGANQPEEGVTTMTTSQQPADAPAQQPQQQQSAAPTATPQPIIVQIGTGIGAQSGGASQPIVQATVVVTIQQPQITLPPVSLPPIQVQPQTQTQPQPGANAQLQVEGVSGQATTPFYIVQSGDTLWSIAIKFDTTVEALKAANQLEDNLIKPNQLLYLPQSQPQQPSQPPPQPSDGSAAPVPSMPNTGINTRP